jgi:large repetitive protein
MLPTILHLHLLDRRFGTLTRLLLALALCAGFLAAMPPQGASAATQCLGGVAGEGQLRICVYDDGRMSVEKYTSGSWQQQIYGLNAKGSRLQDSSGTSLSLGYYGGNPPTLVQNTTSGNVIDTRWTYGSYSIRQLTTYTTGNQYYRLDWTISRSGSSASDLRFFHGEDTYLSGGDNGAGFWDAANRSIGVQKNVGGSMQRLVLQGVTVPHAYESRNYSDVRNSVNNGALTNAIDPNESTDNGYALEWRRASLGSGENWSITAYESFTNLAVGAVNVVAPIATVCDSGTNCDLTYTVSNPGTGSVTVNFAVTTNQPTWGHAITSPGSSATIGAGGSIPVVVRVSVPAGTPNGTLGSFTLTATPTTGGDPASDTASVEARVAGAPPTAFSAQSPPNGTFGAAYSYTFVADGSPAPTYTVFSGTLPPGLTLNSSTGALTGTPTSAGTYGGLVIRATNTFGSINTSTLTIDIARANTATNITGDLPDPSVYGQNYTVSVSVASATSGTPAGVVDVSDGTNSCSINLSGGAGSCSLPSTSVGPKTLTASYAGSANYNASSGTAGHIVNHASTTTSLASSLNPSTHGQVVSFTAVVAVLPPGAGQPTGQVQFTIDGASFGDPVTLVGGQAMSPSISHLTAGERTIAASYLGDANFDASTSSLLSQNVEAADTAIGISSPYNPAPYGAPLQITASVTALAPSQAVPDGQVQFRLDGVDFGEPVDLLDGEAVSQNVPPALGSYTFTAEYLGNANFNPSSSDALEQQIEKAATTTSVTSAVNPSVYGQNVSLTASVAALDPSLAIPDGTVQFRLNGVNIGAPVALNAAGQALRSVPFTALWPGVHQVTAIYAGAANFHASDNLANPYLQTVERATPVAGLTPSATAVVSGEPFSMAITLAGQPPHIGTPSGNVTLYLDGSLLAGPLALDSQGRAVVAGITLTPGSHTFNLHYSGDDYFLPQELDFVDPLEVSMAGTATELLGFEPEALVVGQPALVSVAVVVLPPGAGTPTGSVLITNGADSCTAELAEGAGACLLIPTNPGQPELSAAYSGDPNFSTSADALPGPEVFKADSLITDFSFDPGDPVVGQPVTLSLTVLAAEPGSGIPTGEVLVGNGTDFCIVTLTDGAGACLLAPSASGQPEFSAAYSGDERFNPADLTEIAGPLVDRAGTTTILLGFEPEALVVGQPALVSAAVVVLPPGAGTPTGSVLITNGADSCTAELADGAGACLLTPAAPGQPELSAVYSGDANFNPSANALPGPEVDKAGTATLLMGFEPAALVVGQPALVSVAVAVLPPGAGTPTGEVLVTNGADACTITLADGAGACLLTPTHPGQPELSAAYSGDANFNPSADTLPGPEVSKAESATLLMGFEPEALVVGQPALVSVTVTALPPGAGVPTGEVLVTNGADSCTAELADGAGVCLLIPTNPGQPELSATYSGDPNFSASADSLPGPEVSKADALITGFSFDPTDPVVGQPITVSLTVLAAEPGSGTPTGEVLVTGDEDACTITLTDGAGACQITPLVRGPMNLAADYSGDPNFNPAATIGIAGPDVGWAATLVELSSTAAGAVYGQPLGFTAAVSVTPPGSGEATGLVQFYLNGLPLGGPVALQAGVAQSPPVDLLSVGEHTITAVYGGNGRFEGSAGEITQPVVRAGTTTSVISLLNPSPYGMPVTVIAAAQANSPSQATPAGAIQFIVDGVNYGAAVPMDASGQAEKILPYTALWVGEHTVTAVYSGSANFHPSDNLAGPLMQVVLEGETSISAAPIAPTVYGEPVSFTITVAPEPANPILPTGTIQVSLGGEPLGGPLALDESGMAVTPAISTLPAGLYDLSISYSGDEQFAAREVTLPDAHEVLKAETTIGDVAIDPIVVAVGQPFTVSLTVETVAPGAGMPGGEVLVSNGADACAVELVAGAGACQLTPSFTGEPDLQLHYSGDLNFNPTSLLNVPGPEVGSAQTQTIVAVSEDSPVYMQPLAFTAEVSASGPGNPGGTVQFYLNELPIGDPMDLQDGLAELQLAEGLMVGSYLLSAAYSGDSNFDPSSALELAFEVGAAEAAIVLSAQPNPAPFGQEVNVLAVISGAPVSTGVPQGTLQLVIDGLPYGEPLVLDVAGQADVAIPGGMLPIGIYELAASYSGSENFHPANNLENPYWLEVSRSETILTAVPSVNPSVFGQSVDFTITVAPQPTMGTLPGGSVSVYINGELLAEDLLLDESGQAVTLPTASLTVGLHDLTVVYSGDEGFAPASSILPGAHLVERADTAVAVIDIDPPVVLPGEAVTIHVAVSALAPGTGIPGGTVVINGGDDNCTAELLDGTGACQLTPVAPGQPDLLASYSGDEQFNPAELAGIPGPVVDRLPSVVTITGFEPEALVVGQLVAITVEVAAGVDTNLIPTGTVTVSSGVEDCLVTLAEGAGVCMLTPMTAGELGLLATYSGNDFFDSSLVTAPGPQVAPAGTVTTITGFEARSVVVGQSFEVEVLVEAAAPGSGIPSGTVEVSSGADACSVTLEDGRGSCQLVPSQAGQTELTASYVGDENYLASDVSIPGPQVERADTELTITGVSPEQVVVGQPFVVEVLVTVAAPGAGLPGGTVEVGNGEAFCSFTLTDGQGGCELTSFLTGQPELTASYSGDDNYQASATTAAGPQVSQADTELTITGVSPEQVVVGQPFVVEVLVTVAAPGAGLPGGMVEVFAGDGVCSLSLADGKGSCELIPTAVGDLTIEAVYAGDSSFNGSSAAVAGPQVGRAETAITITGFEPERVVVGQPFTVMVQVAALAPSQALPEGEVTILFGPESCPAVLVEGQAACQLTPMSTALAELQAVYTGTEDFYPSEAAAAAGPEVTQAGTLVIMAGPQTSSHGEPVQWTAAVQAAPPGSGSPTGMVQFMIDGQAFGEPVALVDGQAASELIATLTGGAHLIGASYLGDDNFLPSSAEGWQHIVSPFRLYFPIGNR